MNTCSAKKVNSRLNNGASLRLQNSRNVHAEELRIVIIGKTGTGKSATGNSILGKKTFESKVCGASVTNKCKLGIEKRFGRKIVLVDTPGLFDTEMTNERVTKEIVKCIGMTAPGPHAFLLTVNIGRFTKEEQDTVKHFVDHFGDGIYKFLTVVFTRADDLENDNMAIESYIKEAPHKLKEILQLCGNRYVPFNNKLTGANQELQVKQLINIIDDVVNKNGGSCFTNEMYQEAEKTLRRQEEEMKRKLHEEERRKFEKLQNKLDKRFAENDRKREKEIESLMIENERKLQEIRHEYEQRLNPSNLRDDNRKGCEKETGILPSIWTGIKGFFKVANVVSLFLPDDEPYSTAKKAITAVNSIL